MFLRTLLFGFALSQTVHLLGAQPGTALHLRNRRAEMVPNQATTDVASGKRWRKNLSHYLIQFRAPVNEQIRSELARRGAVITASIPDRSVMIVASDQFTTFGMNVEYTGRLLPIDKLSPVLPSAPFLIAVVEFHPDVDSTSAGQILDQEGVTVLPNSDLMPQDYLVQATPSQLKSLVGFDEIAYVFPASPDLTAGNAVSACAGALSQSGTVPHYAFMGHGWTPDSAGQVNLTYVFDQLTGKLPADQVKSELERAFREWTRYAPVHFVEGTDGHAPQTINIQFASGAHGDPFPFDGPGNILAHTFYPAPPNPEPIAGDMHFDADEAWHVGTSVDLYTVALHETGHALGLGHSDDPQSVMYPYYRYGKQLGGNDVAAIQALYGKPAGDTTDAPMTTTSATPAPSPSPVAPTPVIPAAAPLLLTVDSPSLPNSSTTYSQTAASGHVTNSSGTVHVSWQTDHGLSGTASGSLAWSINGIPLFPGSNTITIMASDDHQHTAARSFQVSRAGAVQVNTTAPSLNIISPATSIVSTTNSSIVLRGTASSPTTLVSVSWTGIGGKNGTATGTSTWSAMVPLYVGTNQITVQAFDVDGNSRSTSVTVVRQ